MGALRTSIRAALAALGLSLLLATTAAAGSWSPVTILSTHSAQTAPLLARTTGPGVAWLHLFWTVPSPTHPAGALEYRRSADGSSWTPAIILGEGSPVSVAASGAWVYLVAAGHIPPQGPDDPPEGTSFAYLATNGNHGKGAWTIRALADAGSISASGNTLRMVVSTAGAITLRTSLDHGASWTDEPFATGTRATVAEYYGRIVVAWARSVSVFARISIDHGATWTSETLLATATPIDPLDPVLAAGPIVAAMGDRLAVTWIDKTGVRVKVALAGAWQPIHVATYLDTSARAALYWGQPDPALVLSGSQALAVVWSQCRCNLSTPQVDLMWHGSSHDGTGWSAQTEIAHGIADTAARALAAGDSRRYVAWSSWDPAHQTRWDVFIRSGFGTP